jgi:hypothetical protein
MIVEAGLKQAAYKRMAPQVGRFSLNTPIFSVMKVKQLARRKQGQKRFSHNY